MKVSENRRLILFISVLLVAGFLATSLGSYYVSKESVRDSIIKHRLPLTSDTIYSEVQRDLFRPVIVSSLMSRDTFLRDWAIGGEKDVNAVTRYLAEIKTKYGFFTSFFISERTRLYYHANGILKKVDENEPRDAWYFRVRQMKPDYEINVDPDMANRDAMTIFINYRVYDYRGKFIGIAGAGLTVDAVRRLILDYEKRFAGNIFFADTKGRLVLTGAGISPKFRTIREEPGYRDIAEAALSGEGGNFRYNRGKGMVFVNVRFIPELQWFLFVEQSEDPSLEGLRATLYRNLGVCLVITAIVLSATGFTVNRYQRRVAAHARELEAAKERAENATRLKDNFVSLVSHDIRGPLSTIIGYINVALNERQPDGSFHSKIEEWLNLAQNVSFSLADATTRILDISRLQSGKITPAMGHFHIRDLFERAAEKAARQAAEKNIAILNEIPGDCMVLCDSGMIGEVLLNLVTNAVKFTKSGGAVTAFSPAPGMVAVKDTGIGIRPELLPDLFKHEVRTSTPGTSDESGTGLGLPYCADIMAAHGGSIRAETSPGGSVFYLEFPALPKNA